MDIKVIVIINVFAFPKAQNKTFCIDIVVLFYNSMNDFDISDTDFTQSNS